jgi:DNA-directed RNA polymerase subunit RPC12/RpoP
LKIRHCSHAVKLLVAYVLGNLGRYSNRYKVDVLGELLGQAVRVEGDSVKCLFCGRRVRRHGVARHMYVYHCKQLVELLESKPIARWHGKPRGRSRPVKVVYVCGRCNHVLHTYEWRVEQAKPKARELYIMLKTTLGKCPYCGHKLGQDGFRVVFQPENTAAGENKQ